MRLVFLTNNSRYAKRLAWILTSNFPEILILVEEAKQPFNIKYLISNLIGSDKYLKWSNAIISKKEKLLLIEENKMKTQANSNFDLFRTTWPEVSVIKVDNLNNQIILRQLEKFKPNVGLVFGTRILKRPLIEKIPKLINFHSSILPKYRGYFPELWQVLDNDQSATGYTIHEIDTGVDTGNILFQQKIMPISNNPFLLRNQNLEHFFNNCIEIINNVYSSKLVSAKQEVKSGYRTFRYKDLTPEVMNKIIKKNSSK